eukprot:1718732-Alexandrium_andersonii.AAC.1
MQVETIFMRGALKGAGRRSSNPQSDLYHGLDGPTARQRRLQMHQEGRGDLLELFNQRLPPRASPEDRTHPVALDLTWSVMRVKAFGYGLAGMADDIRRQLLEEHVEA